MVGRSANNPECHKSAIAICPTGGGARSGQLIQGEATGSIRGLLTDVVFSGTLVDANLTTVRAMAAEEEPTGAS